MNRGLLQISDLVRSGHPKTVLTDNNVQRIDKLIREHGRIMQHETASLVCIPKERVNHIIKNELKF